MASKRRLWFTVSEKIPVEFANQNEGEIGLLVRRRMIPTGTYSTFTYLSCAYHVLLDDGWKPVDETVDAALILPKIFHNQLMAMRRVL
jgi:hypothetical protein